MKSGAVAPTRMSSFVRAEPRRKAMPVVRPERASGSTPAPKPPEWSNRGWPPTWQGRPVLGQVSQMAFEVEQRRYPDTRTTVVRPVGELSAGSMRELRTAVRRAVRDDSAVIVVDLVLASMSEADMVVPLVEAARLGQAYGT